MQDSAAELHDEGTRLQAGDNETLIQSVNYMFLSLANLFLANDWHVFDPFLAAGLSLTMFEWLGFPNSSFRGVPDTFLNIANGR